MEDLLAILTSRHKKLRENREMRTKRNMCFDKNHLSFRHFKENISVNSNPEVAFDFVMRFYTGD